MVVMWLLCVSVWVLCSCIIWLVNDDRLRWLLLDGVFGLWWLLNVVLSIIRLYLVLFVVVIVDLGSGLVLVVYSSCLLVGVVML